jgi:hypothetical protein
MQKYKVTGPRPVEGAAPGEELEHEFTAEQEQYHLDAKRLEIIPRTYRVIGPSQLEGPGYSAGPGETYSAALTVGQEAALIEAGHIERVKEPAKKKTEVKN